MTGGTGWEIVRRCQGHLIYTLDDCYIHLALAQRLALGHYGINMSEITAPASSILWPFLLVPFARAPCSEYFPLILNVIFAGLCAFLLGRMIDRLPWPDGDRFCNFKKALVALVFVFIGNLAGLVFMGMEHSLQLLISVVGAYALIEAWEGRRIPAWCLVIVAIGPMVRYEMFAIVAAVAVALVGRSRLVAAGSLVAASAIVPISFSLYLVANGLPFLPNSVLAKTGAYKSASHSMLVNTVKDTLGTLRDDLLNDHPRQIELLMILALAFLSWKTRGPARWPVAAVLLALSIHFLCGRFNWFHRYEIFAITFGAIFLYRVVAPLQGWRFAGGILFLSAVALPYLKDTPLIPIASQNTYDQQYQLHRFVDDYYKKTFAVNDLGWVSFQLEPSIYVLDLYGLASNEALRQTNRNAEWLSRITHEHRVGLVMIYREWFKSIPRDWVQVADLALSGKRITCASAHVVFFVTPDGDRTVVLQELKEFSKTLPPQARIQLSAEPEQLTGRAP